MRNSTVRWEAQRMHDEGPRIELVPYLPLAPARDNALHTSLVAALAVSAIFLVARALGLTALNLEAFYGSLLLGEAPVGVWALGLLMHVGICGLLGQLYKRAFSWLGGPGVRAGLALGAMHFLILTTTLRWLEAFSPTFENVLLLLIAQLIFGTIFGSLFRKRQEPQEERHATPLQRQTDRQIRNR